MKIFTTGAVTNWDSPLGWHDDIRDEYDEYEIINPYEFGSDEIDIYDEPEKALEPALDAVTDVDGVLVHWDDGVSLPATTFYCKEAYDNDIPIVVWYTGDSQPSPAMLWISQHRIYETYDKALQVLDGLHSPSFEL